MPPQTKATANARRPALTRSFPLRLGLARSFWRKRGCRLSGEPFGLQPLSVAQKSFLCESMLRHCLRGSTWRNALRASRSALEICFGGSYSPGVFVIGFPIFISRSCLSVWPIYSDVPEFLRTFKEATLTAGLIVRTCCGIRHVVYRSTCHFARPLFLAFLGLVTFRLYGQPDLDQPASPAASNRNQPSRARAPRRCSFDRVRLVS